MEGHDAWRVGLGGSGAVLGSVSGESLCGFPKIAFVDTGDTGRSLTAETIAKLYALSHNLDARFISCGIDVNPYETKIEMDAQSQSAAK